MSYKLCCSAPRIVGYSLYHTVLSDDDCRLATNLLLYLPEIDSYQAENGTAITNDIYESYFLSEVKRILSLNDDDIEINNSTPDRTIDDAVAYYYKDSICLNCSKINVAQCKGKNKIISIFVKIRNMVAHGSFNIVDGVFIGFDHPRLNSSKCCGIIKAQTANLFELVKTFISIGNTPGLFKYILSKNFEYTIIESTANDNDFMIEKDRRRYFLEFKSFSGRYINQEDLVLYLRQRAHIDKTDCMFVLVVDSTYTNSKINAVLLEYNISIIDKRWIKEMMDGKDVFLELSEMIRNNKRYRY